MGKLLVSLKRLEEWFEKQKRILPWRDNPSTYRVWVSEIMLQQTQVTTVIPYFERFIARFPSVEDLARAPLEDVLLHWAGLGYYSRARNLHRAALDIVRRGRFPKSREEWLEISGVGNYTAGAILSIAENLPEAILDGNVERVLSRLRRVSRTSGDMDFKARLWRLSKILVETAHSHQIQPRVLNQALMELGAMVCTPKNPRCLLCPLSELCKAREAGDPEAFPPKKKPKAWIHIEENLHCVLDHSGRVLLKKREAGEWRAGLWDLLSSSPDELGNRFSHLGSVTTKHVVTRHKITRKTEGWKVSRRDWKAAEKGLDNQQGLKWVEIRNPEVAVGSAVRITLQSVLERYS
jgi:A/G-specific adenine glycosylase